ncbi:type III pantothenate kinase [bacterium]|nr:type III pantothenate kinase [bacterium]
MNSVLAMDMGNSGLKAVLFENGKIEKRWRFKFDKGFKYVSEVLKESSPRGIVLCSVVPEWTTSFLDKIEHELYERVLYVDSDVNFPFPILLSNPGEVGTDRLCAVCGVVELGIKEAIIVDVGTAITVDVLSLMGYEGGTIFPGVEMILNSLHRETAVLPDLKKLSGSGTVPGKSTKGAIESGTFWGVLGAIEILIRKSIETLSPSAQIFLTGGGAQDISSQLQVSFKIDPDLVFKGLFRLYETGEQISKKDR